MHEYGRCKSTPQITGRCASNTSEPQPYIARRSLLSIAANSESELSLIKSPFSGESQSWIRDHHSYHGTGVLYSPSQMSTYLPLYTMKSRFCRVGKPSFSSVSRSFVHCSQRNLIESPPKGESQPWLRSIYHSYHGTSVYKDFRCTWPQISCV